MDHLFTREQLGIIDEEFFLTMPYASLILSELILEPVDYVQLLGFFHSFDEELDADEVFSDLGALIECGYLFFNPTDGTYHLTYTGRVLTIQLLVMEELEYPPFDIRA